MIWLTVSLFCFLCDSNLKVLIRMLCSFIFQFQVQMEVSVLKLQKIWQEGVHACWWLVEIWRLLLMQNKGLLVIMDDFNGSVIIILEQCWIVLWILYMNTFSKKSG